MNSERGTVCEDSCFPNLVEETGVEFPEVGQNDRRDISSDDCRSSENVGHNDATNRSRFELMSCSSGSHLPQIDPREIFLKALQQYFFFVISMLGGRQLLTGKRIGFVG